MLLNICSNELKSYVHTKSYTPIFIAALYITAKNWKQPRCPSIGEWTNKLCYIHVMVYHSIIKKKNQLSSYEKTWDNLKGILIVK